MAEVSLLPINYATVLCCLCGVPIAPNAVNTCANCLASSADITKGISTEATLHQCRGCGRWHKEAGKWIACELESRELMALCLEQVSGLKKKPGQEKVRLVDASWIWTEPHSMRLKVRLTIQRQVQGGTILQQSFVVVFVVRNQQCIECQSVFRQGTWRSLVQVRQRVSHKRTFLYLEQLILKHGAHRGCLSVETFRDGMDFYFPDKGKASRFISFLENVTPIKVKTSKKLISTDDKSNIANFKFTNFVEICPLCKDDLVYLPPKLARQLGNISRLVLVKK
jgi:nonsense-mediated mRNA decay protein 3